MTDITFGDKMGSKVKTLKPFNNIVVVYVCILLLYFFFLKGFKSYTWHTKYFRNIKFSLSVHLAVCKSFVRPHVRPFVYF